MAFVLLLYQDAGYRDARQAAERAAEYGRWARTLPAPGEFVLGEPLADAAAVLPTPVADAREPYGNLSGFFVVRERDFPSAIALARTCPHLKYGGRIIVLPVRGS
ncbi:MAG: hypothetical protein ACRENP_25320 [Longimicrobiales bacterium]